jgi:drug/metabolite transporter (DMT)-like permease
VETGILYAIVAGIFWGTSPVLVKRGLVHADVSAATLYQQATILIMLIAAALIEGELFAGIITPRAILVFAFTGVVGAYLGRTLFVKTVDQIGASRAQSLNNSSPLITVLLAALFLNEPLTLIVVVGVVLIISGVFFVTETDSQDDLRDNRKLLTLTSVMATVCYGIVPVLKKFGTENGGTPVMGALVMHATGLLLLVTLGSLLKIEFKPERIAASSVGCFVTAGFLYAIGSILTLKALTYAPASVAAPVWSAQPIVSFFLVKTTLKGIEAVSWRDGMAAVLVVAGVIVLRLA